MGAAQPVAQLGLNLRPKHAHGACLPHACTHTCTCCMQVPYLRSEYGKEYDFDAPVKLLDRMMHGHSDTAGQQVVVLSQVLAADVNIGYEEILNTQVRSQSGGDDGCWGKRRA